MCAIAGASLFACSLACFAETSVACDQTLTAPFQWRSALTIDSRPAGLEIVGTDEQTVRITCTSNDSDEDLRHNVILRFEPARNGGKLSIEGPHARHNGNLQIKIEVPRKTNLMVRMPAGQVKVEEVVGDKDIELYAGQITISSERAWNYRKINASVTIGDVRAAVYGADKGGFFRSFTKRNSDGEYYLFAHVTTGQVELVGRKAHADNDHKPD